MSKLKLDEIMPLQALSVEAIERVIGHQIPDSPLDPQYYCDGTPILLAKGQQLLLPYQHAVAYAHWIMNKSPIDTLKRTTYRRGKTYQAGSSKTDD